ncbi:MAG: glutamate formimidoyltransferase [Anaerolineae bacterium]|nr:glutamate formimidoyltransferase [Anaerolineae bacterium]NIN98811.1 glutamate formimidoyltransferase [Anaerolineae bacterium]NIQ81730.1 glutamate formimidoyltransferase [Anaerolineae bacterium]
MSKIVECVPNFSEGRRKDVVDEIVAAITAAGGVKLLDVEMDADHNRSVVTFAGRPEAVEEAAFRGIQRAAALIDMEEHEGAHPRIGAADVVPFVPISGVTMEECVEMAQRLGAKVAAELDIPVYLYEKAATRQERVNLANIRRGEYEGLKQEIATDPEKEPDFGPKRLGKAGASVIGAREPLIAYNVYLSTDDLEIAQAIARAVRHSSGGLRYVKALGLEIEQRGQVQVSMNLTNYARTPVHRVFELIKREAARYGVDVVSSEVVGLIPRQALLDAAEFHLQIENFAPQMVLETHLEEPGATPEAFLDDVAAPTPTPGGGSGAALAGALAAALTSMVCNLTLSREREDVPTEELKSLLHKTETLRHELAALVQEDARAYQQVLDAYRLPKASAKEKKTRSKAVQEALEQAAKVPLRVAERAMEVLELVPIVLDIGIPSAASDVGVAAYMAQGALKGAALNVRTNLTSIRDPALTKRHQGQLSSLEGRAEELMNIVEKDLAQRI